MDKHKEPFRFKKNSRGFSEITFPFLRSIIITGCRLVFRPKLVNPENMPTTGSCFVYGNHSNYVDPFLVNTWMYNEPTAGVMTREQFHKTIPALFMDSIGIVPTSKYVPEPGVIRSVIKMIDQKRMIVIFPEAGRRWDGRPKPFLESTIKLFHKMDIPVHPVQIHGSYLTWPRWADWPRYGKTELHFLKPMLPSSFNTYSEFAKEVIDAAEFDEYDPPEVCIPTFAYKPAAGVQRFIYRCPETGMSGAVYSPDGIEVRSKYAQFRYIMTPSSRLQDDDGELHSLHDMFDKIRSLPILATDGIISKLSGVDTFRMDGDYKLKLLGKSTVIFHKDGITFEIGSQKEHITLSEMLYMSIEGNNKLSITLKSYSIQFELEGHDSALEWREYITRLKAGEQTVNSL
jgi:1-acyl-sn-glycerol-3-phosphate acyltransferase